MPIDSGTEALAQSALSLAQGLITKLVERQVLSPEEVQQLFDEAEKAQQEMAGKVSEETGEAPGASGNARSARMLGGMGGPRPIQTAGAPPPDDMDDYATTRKASWKKGGR